MIGQINNFKIGKKVVVNILNTLRMEDKTTEEV